MYQVRLTTYAGGELEIATSRLSIKSPPGDTDLEANDTPKLQESAPLDYSSQLETTRRARLSGYGEPPTRLTRFTRKASKTIQRCARALDEFSQSPGHILFFTGTLPGTGTDKYEAIARWSSYVVHRLKAWVAKVLPAKYDFYCWELQKRGALHLHYAVHCPDEAIAEKLIAGFKDEWIKLLKVVSEKTGKNLFHNGDRDIDWLNHPESIQAKTERVTKSVGAYLGKYLSKSSRGTTKFGRFSPCRWWGCSRPLRRLEESMREEHIEYLSKPGKAIEFADDVLTFAGNMADSCFRWVNRIGHGVGGIVFGMVPGTLKQTVSIIKKGMLNMIRLDQKVFAAYTNLHRVITLASRSYPRWFAAFSRNSGHEDWLQFNMGQSVESLRTPVGICRLQAFVWRLEEQMSRPIMYGGRTLDPRWRTVILHEVIQVKGVLKEIYHEEAADAKYEDYYSLLAMATEVEDEDSVISNGAAKLPVERGTGPNPKPNGYAPE